IDALEARRYAATAEQDGEHIGGLASWHPVTAIVEADRGPRQADRFTQHLTLALDNGGQFGTVFIGLAVRIPRAGSSSGVAWWEVAVVAINSGEVGDGRPPECLPHGVQRRQLLELGGAEREGWQTTRPDGVHRGAAAADRGDLDHAAAVRRHPDPLSTVVEARRHGDTRREAEEVFEVAAHGLVE